MKSARTIYIVDDDEDDRMLMREAIENAVKEVNIIEVIDGKQLIELIEKQNILPDSEPTLIMLDMNMPRMSGLESLLILRNNQKIRHIPIIMLSTTSNQQLILEAYKLGIKAFITKPASINEYSVIAEAINVCFLNNDPSSEISVSNSWASNHSVLIIEDNSDHWELMNSSLKKSAPTARVTRVPGLVSAMEFLTTELLHTLKTPDLILLDLYIPSRLSGLTALNMIREFCLTKGLPAIPIVMLSSSRDSDDIDICYRNEANAYMVKSHDLQKSFSYLQNLFHFWWHTNTLPGKFRKSNN